MDSGKLLMIFIAAVMVGIPLVLLMFAGDGHSPPLPPPKQTDGMDSCGLCKQCGMPRCKAGKLPHIAGHI